RRDPDRSRPAALGRHRDRLAAEERAAPDPRDPDDDARRGGLPRGDAQRRRRRLPAQAARQERGGDRAAARGPPRAPAVGPAPPLAAQATLPAALQPS